MVTLCFYAMAITAPFLFEIYGPSGLLSSTQTNGSTIQFNPLINGQYYFIVTDDLGCVSDTAFINVSYMPSSIVDIQNSKELIRVVDVLGREVDLKNIIYKLILTKTSFF